MATLSPGELRKRNNFSLFKTRILTNGYFLISESNGQKVKIKPEVGRNIKSVDDLIEKYTVNKSIVLPTSLNKTIRLTELFKDSVFSGREQNTTRAEDAQITLIRRKLIEIKEKIGSDAVTLKIGKNYYRVVDVESTPGTPKSDFNFIAENGQRVGFVSHKDGISASSIQQWGGMSMRAEPLIAAHPETQSFVATLLGMYPDGIPQATTVARKIRDNNLKMMAVYGNGYGGPTGIQNVDLLLQGTVSITQVSPGKYKLIASTQTHNNGDSISGLYEPVFMAIYKGDRSDYGLKGARMVISALGGRRIKSYV